MTSKPSIDELLKEYLVASNRKNQEAGYSPPSSPPPPAPPARQPSHPQMWNAEDTGQYLSVGSSTDERIALLNDRLTRKFNEVVAMIGQQPNPIIRFRGTAMWEFLGDMREEVKQQGDTLNAAVVKMNLADQRSDTWSSWIGRVLWKVAETSIAFGVLAFIAYMAGFRHVESQPAASPPSAVVVPVAK